MSNDPYNSPQVHSDPNPPKPGNKDENTMGMLAHLLGIFTSFIGPLIIFLMKKDNPGFASEEAKESLNFQITAAIAYVVSGILMMVLIGILTYLATMVCVLIFCIMGTIKANKGESYRYPINIRFIK